MATIRRDTVLTALERCMIGSDHGMNTAEFFTDVVTRLSNFKIAISILALLANSTPKFVKEMRVLSEIYDVLKGDIDYLFLEADKKWCQTFVPFEDALEFFRKQGIHINIDEQKQTALLESDHKLVPATKVNKRVLKIARTFISHGMIHTTASFKQGYGIPIPAKQTEPSSLPPLVRVKPRQQRKAPSSPPPLIPL